MIRHQPLAARRPVVEAGADRLARVLIVEDEFLQAVLAEDMVIELGYQPVGPVGTIADALKVIEDGAIDCAMLDRNLARERSDLVAARLDADGVPYFFVSGEYTSAENSMDGSSPRTLAKPYTFNALASMLRACIGPRKPEQAA